MKLIRKSENMPVKGIVSSELIITLRTDRTFIPNAAVNINAGGMAVGTHFISRITRKGELLTLHAFDRMRTVENDFDDSGCSKANEPFNTGSVLESLAAQCGFENYSGVFPEVSRLYYGDIHGKKCREILELIAENTVGAWYCDDGGHLRFCRFPEASCSVGIDADKSAPVYIHSVKGPFLAAYGKNTATGDVFSTGDTSDFRRILKLSGRLINSDAVGAAMSSAAGKVWRSFYCAHAAISFLPCGIAEFIRYDTSENGSFGLLSVKTTVHFGAAEIWAEAETADICEDESDYTDLTGYALRRRIEEGRRYGSTVITDEGIGITADKGTDLRGADINFFSAVTDKISRFGGALIDGVMPDSIESVSDTQKRIRYGDTVYKLSYDTDSAGRKYNIRFEQDEGGGGQ